MNWKYGGELKEGKFTYQINMKRNNRPTLIKEPYGTCKGTWYPFEASSVYKMKGMFPISSSLFTHPSPSPAQE